MCWIEIKDNVKYQVADKDIEVYKIVLDASKQSCTSLVRGFNYTVNILYAIPIESEVIDPYCGKIKIDKYEKLGEFKSERTIYEIFNVGVYSNIDYKGLCNYNPDRRYSFISIDNGFLGCATEDIARHFGKYFGMLIIEAMYADIVDFEIVEEKYKI